MSIGCLLKSNSQGNPWVMFQFQFNIQIKGSQHIGELLMVKFVISAQDERIYILFVLLILTLNHSYNNIKKRINHFYIIIYEDNSFYLIFILCKCANHNGAFILSVSHFICGGFPNRDMAIYIVCSFNKRWWIFIT